MTGLMQHVRLADGAMAKLGMGEAAFSHSPRRVDLAGSGDRSWVRVARALEGMAKAEQGAWATRSSLSEEEGGSQR